MQWVNIPDMLKPHSEKQTELDTIPVPGHLELKEDLAAFRKERRRHYLGKLRVLGLIGVVTALVVTLMVLDLWSQTASSPIAIFVFVLLTLAYMCLPFYTRLKERRRQKRWDDIAAGKEDWVIDKDDH